MEEIVKSKGLKLIKKYGLYYIRFIGGEYEEYPCDLRISDEEALSIISNNNEIKSVLNFYKKKTDWNKDYFVNTAIKDYMTNENNMNKEQIKNTMEKLDNNKDIKMEFYETIMYEKFPQNSAITICNKTAESLYKANNINVLESYINLINLREQTNNNIQK